jgi:hypothetical protein
MTSSTAKDLLCEAEIETSHTSFVKSETSPDIEGDLGTTADNHNNDEINVFLDGPEPAPGRYLQHLA